MVNAGLPDNTVLVEFIVTLVDTVQDMQLIDQELKQICSEEEFTILREHITYFLENHAFLDEQNNNDCKHSLQSEDQSISLISVDNDQYPTNETNFKPDPIVWDITSTTNPPKLQESRRFKAEIQALVPKSVEPVANSSSNDIITYDSTDRRFKKELLRVLRDDGKRPRSDSNDLEYDGKRSRSERVERKPYDNDHRKPYDREHRKADHRNSHEYDNRKPRETLTRSSRHENTSIDKEPVQEKIQVQAPPPRVEVVLPPYQQYGGYSSAWKNQTVQCRYFPNCLNAICPYFHPASDTSVVTSALPQTTGVTPCKFGLKCLRPGCYFSHPTANTLANAVDTPSTGMLGSAHISSSRKHISERTYAVAEDSDADPGSNSDGITGIFQFILVVI
jgi:hypothetical protein